MTVLLLILLGGGFIVGFIVGRLDERARAERRRPLAPHEAVALVVGLRGPLPVGVGVTNKIEPGGAPRERGERRPAPSAVSTARSSAQGSTRPAEFETGGPA